MLQTDHEFQCHHSSAHTERDAERDISKLVEHLLDKTVVVHSPKRNTPAFTDPTDTGYKKLCNTSWVQEILSKTGREDCDLDVEDDDMADEETDKTWTMKLQMLLDLTLNQDLSTNNTSELTVFTVIIVTHSIINDQLL